MSDALLQSICDVIQEDVGQRGLRTHPDANLVTATAGDFQAACRALVRTDNATVAIVTGFYIPHAQPPSGETDGPLGAVFLAQALTALGMRVILATDGFCSNALRVGLEACGLGARVPVAIFPSSEESWRMSADVYCRAFIENLGPMPYLLTHLIALERVGPSHTPASICSNSAADAGAIDAFHQEVPPKHHDRCHTMRGRDITAMMSPAHLLFEAAPRQAPRVTTIGIGDGGNEIGMGKIPWPIIRRNVPGGGRVACRVPTDHLIVCGVSNWGAYGLAAGVALLRGQRLEPELFDLNRERELLRLMVEQGSLVDGVTGLPTVSVDGLLFESYIAPLRRIGELLNR